jgi:hypothetical protein
MTDGQPIGWDEFPDPANRRAVHNVDNHHADALPPVPFPVPSIKLPVSGLPSEPVRLAFAGK